MNWKTAFFALLALWVATVIWQCQDADAPSADAAASTTSPDADTDARPPCRVNADTIGADRARQQVSKYEKFKKDNGKAWQDSVGRLKGFAIVDPCELSDMARALGPASEVQLELGINENGEIDIIFKGRKLNPPQGEADHGNGGGNGQEWTYFDFTEPCPPGCDQ